VLGLTGASEIEITPVHPPVTVFGRNAVESFFTPQEIRDLLEFLHSLAA
jgi:hypothetical protein